MAGAGTGLRLAAAVASGTAAALLPVPLIALPALAPLGRAVAAPVAPACGTDAAQPGNPIVDVPWQQKWLDPERVWPLATGAGQTVAVIDTGVDGTHQQLRGQVLPGFDELRDVPQGDVDCVSHGTAVASLIAATKVDSVGFHGIAPGAKILPVRVSNVDPATDPDGPKQASIEDVAKAITWAADNGATVIEVSPSFTVDVPSLREAVRAAIAKGIPIVAAAGDRRNPDYATDPPTYPAAYDGVVGVGAVGATFDVWSTSNIGFYVRVSAPGDGVVADTRLAGQQTWSGTSIAAGSVAGTVALLRQVAPQLTPAQVATRIEATADPAPGGQLGPAYGAGLVDAYRAVTERPAVGRPRAIPGVAPPSVDPAVVAREASLRNTRDTALLILAIVGGLLVLFVAAALVVPRGQAARLAADQGVPAAGPFPRSPSSTTSSTSRCPRHTDDPRRTTVGVYGSGGMGGRGMDSGGVDLDRMLAVLRRRVLDDGERVTDVRPIGGPEAWISTDKRELDVYHPDWRVLRAPWVADAVVVAWEASSPSHYDDQVYGLIFGRDGRDHLLSWREDDLSELGRRLAIDDPEAIEPAAFAELLAFFHTAPYQRGVLIDDPAHAGDRFPGIAAVPGLHPVRTRRDGGQVTVEFQAYQVYPQGGEDSVVIREWTVLASADRPTTWTEREVAKVAG